MVTEDERTDQRDGTAGWSRSTRLRLLETFQRNEITRFSFYTSAHRNICRHICPSENKGAGGSTLQLQLMEDAKQWRLTSITPDLDYVVEIFSRHNGIDNDYGVQEGCAYYRQYGVLAVGMADPREPRRRRQPTSQRADTACESSCAFFLPFNSPYRQEHSIQRGLTKGVGSATGR